MTSRELTRLVDAGRRAWPDIEVPRARFERHLAACVADADDPAAALQSLEVADLYLAFACAEGDPAAIRELDRRFIAKIAAPGGAMAADELRQQLRARLLVGSDGRPPPIAGYRGRGPLGAWLRVTAARLIVNHRQAGKSTGPLDARAPLRTAAPDPELEYLKRRYGREFEQVFEATLKALPSREASLLRMFALEGMTTKEIGALYRVSDRTVQRWLADIRSKIVDDVHAELAARLKASPSEIGSLYNLVRSQLDVSLPKYFRR